MEKCKPAGAPGKRKSRVRVAPLLKAVVASLAVIVILGAGVGVYLVNRLMALQKASVEIVDRPADNIGTPVPVKDESLQSVEGDPDDLNVDHGVQTDETAEVPIYATGRLRKYVFSVLLVAQTGSVKSAERQTDTIMLFSYNAATQKLTTVSFLRDCWVPIEGHDFNRLAAAYSYGGVGLVTNTINDYFGLDLQNYAVTGVTELARIIDDLGGVELTLTAEEAAYVGAHTGASLPAEGGSAQLTGAQAMAYALDRTSGGNGDFSRSERQQKLVTAFFRKLRAQATDEAGMRKLLSLVLSGLQTNVELGLLAETGKEIIKADKVTFVTARAPADGCWSYAKKEGESVISVDAEANKPILMEALYAG